MWRRSSIFTLVVIVLTATSASALWFITDMFDQPSIKPQEGTPRGLPVGAVPTKGLGVPTNVMRDQLWPTLTANPIAYTPESVEKGKHLYDTFCISCHGATGMGDGPVAQKGVKPWMTLDSELVQMRPDQYIFAQIWVGGIVMGPYWFYLEEDEAWHLVNYVRSLGK